MPVVGPGGHMKPISEMDDSEIKMGGGTDRRLHVINEICAPSQPVGA